MRRSVGHHLIPSMIYQTVSLRLSEKSRTPLQRSLTGHRNGTFRAVLAFVYWPNLRSKLRSDPFSDSFSRNCLINRSRYYFGVPRASIRGQTSPILPPRASRTPRSGSPPAIYQTVSLGSSVNRGYQPLACL